MKKIITAILCVAMLAAMAISVSAAPDKASFGEAPMYVGGDIEIDGVLDPAFTEFGVACDLDGVYTGTSYNKDGDAKGTMYVLHDGEYLYIAFEIDNGTAVVLPKTEPQVNWYQEHAIEFYLDWKNEGANSARYDLVPSDKYFADEANSKNVKPVAFDEYMGSFEGNNYVIELKIKFQDGVKAGDTIGICCDVITRDDPNTPKQQYITIPTIVSGTAVCNAPANYPQVTLTTEEVAFEEEVTEEAPAASAATADVAVIVAAVSALLSAGVVASKKRH